MTKWTRKLFRKRFDEKVVFTKDHWIWEGATDSGGYPSMWWEGRSVGAYKLAYTYWNGPIPKNHDIHHICKVRACVNPEHLTTAAHAEHLELHTLERQQEPHYCTKGHLIEEGNRYKNGTRWRCKKCIDDKRRWLVG